MFRHAVFIGLSIMYFFAVPCWAQDEMSSPPVEITVCELLSAPSTYAGRMVRVRGWLSRGKDLALLDMEPRKGCPAELVAVVLPGAAKPKPEFDVVRDESFDKLFDALGKRTHIEGTFEGRVDSAVVLKEGKRIKFQRGFGHRGRATMRLVLRKVSDLDIRPTRSVDR